MPVEEPPMPRQVRWQMREKPECTATSRKVFLRAADDT